MNLYHTAFQRQSWTKSLVEEDLPENCIPTDITTDKLHEALWNYSTYQRSYLLQKVKGKLKSHYLIKVIHSLIVESVRG